MEKRTARRIVTMAIILILLAGLACGALIMCGSETPLAGARASAVNALLDSTGVKERLDAELRTQAERVAQQTGVPVEVLDAGIDMLDITHWEAADLPDDVAVASSFELEVEGQDVTVTAYDDPSYVTIGAFGQEVTFDVPTSAQSFTSLAPYLDGLQGLGLEDILQI